MRTDGTVDGRNAGIDVFRGLLVIGVILGHFFEVTQRTSFLTWLGAGIRMPLFIGLTGYMFNLERARLASLGNLLRRYYPRLILPWLFACLIHLVLTRQIDAATPLALLLWPPFHLWFVPVMLVFIMLAAAARWTPPTMFAIAFPFSLAAMYLLGVGHVAELPHPWLPDRRFFIYPIYFFYGLWVARRTIDRGRVRAALILAPIGILWWCNLYDAPSVTAEVAAELTSCLPLIALLPVIRNLPVAVPPIAAIGRDSLFYYLWHPMAFGLWSVFDIRDLWMLALSMVALMTTRAILAQSTSLSAIFGLTARPVIPLPDPASGPACDPAPPPTLTSACTFTPSQGSTA